MKTLTREEQITNFLSKLDTDIQIMDHLTDCDIEELNDLEEGQAEWLFDHLNDSGAFNVDIIYYDNAMEYLSKHDNSLCDSMEIADEYGLRPCDLNSETLASLLASRKATENFWEAQKEIETFFEELNENEPAV